MVVISKGIYPLDYTMNRAATAPMLQKTNGDPCGDRKSYHTLTTITGLQGHSLAREGGWPVVSVASDIDANEYESRSLARL